MDIAGRHINHPWRWAAGIAVVGLFVAAGVSGAAEEEETQETSTEETTTTTEEREPSTTTTEETTTTTRETTTTTTETDCATIYEVWAEAEVGSQTETDAQARLERECDYDFSGENDPDMTGLFTIEQVADVFLAQDDGTFCVTWNQLNGMGLGEQAFQAWELGVRQGEEQYGTSVEDFGYTTREVFNELVSRC